MRLSLSVRKAWTGLIVLVSIMPVAILLLWGGRIYYGLLLEQALQQEQHFTQMRLQHVRQEISRLVTLLQNKSDPMAYTLARDQDRQLLDELLAKIISREPTVHYLLILEPDGQIISGAQNPMRDREDGTDPRHIEEHWMPGLTVVRPELAVPLGGNVYTGAVALHPEGALFSLSVPIGPPSRPLAVLLAGIDAHALWGELETQDDKFSFQSYLVDNEGKLLSASLAVDEDKGQPLTRIPIVKAFADGVNWPRVRAYQGLQGKHVFGSVTPVEEMNWAIVTEVDRSQLLGPIRSNLIKMLMFVSALGLAFFLLGLLLVNRMIKPITEISADFERVGKHDYSPSRVPTQLKELRAMMGGFNRMVAEIDSSQKDLRQAAVVFDSTAEAITITDSENRIIAVNEAFTRITGYAADDVIGRKPSMLKSGRHDEAFYQSMWQSLNETGQWRGELWNRRKNGEIFPELLTVNTVTNDAGDVTNYVGVFGDISTIKETELKLDHLAHHDALTGLPNRLLFHARLDHALQRAQRDKSKLAVLYLDLDRFKDVNDSMGHACGDKLLQLVAERLCDSRRADDTIARLGGDEFVLLIEETKSLQDAAVVAEKILLLFDRPFNIESREFYINASIGISLYPKDAGNSDDLLRNADTAMYRAKSTGRNNYQFYTAELTAAALERLTVETNLRYALERDEFQLYYQPQFSLMDGTMVGMEALIRWFHPEEGMVPPLKFIPLAEDTGLIIPIGEWVLRTACEQHQAWVAAGYPPFKIAVNLSARQFHKPGLVKVISNILEENGIDPAWLELELTESIIMGDEESAIKTLTELHQMGLQISIDDFGTGYSSLSYMKRFPIGKLKIDQSFVRDIGVDQDDAEIVISIIALAKGMKLQVIAEGVETEQQLHFLQEQGCHEAQGYYYSRPVPAEELVKFFS